MANSIADAPARATKAPPRAKEAPAPAPEEQQVSSGLSPSLIVLSLRPVGSKFNGNRIERAQEAGFGWLHKVHMIGMSDPDTGNEIARHVVHGGHEALGVLQEIQIHVDPESCAWMWKAGEELMARLKKYAILIGARVCDGVGQSLTEEAMLAIGEHIDSAMAKRRDADRLARTVTLPSGEQRELSELSFVYTVIREAGSKKKSYRRVRFDAPSLHYYEGQALGMQMAGEVVNYYRNHQTQHLDILSILREAMALSGCSYDKATQANVASGFIDVFRTLIQVGARQLNPAWLEHQIAQQSVHHARWLEDREKRKVEFVTRMKAARKAKLKNGGGNA